MRCAAERVGFVAARPVDAGLEERQANVGHGSQARQGRGAGRGRLASRAGAGSSPAVGRGSQRVDAKAFGAPFSTVPIGPP